MSASESRILYFDGWRGIAIICVMVGHFFYYEPDMMRFGPLGVELFFALSGRLMGEILFVKEERLGEFYKRRIARVYPTMLVYILITTIVTQGTGLQTWWRPLLHAVTLTYNYGPWIPGFYYGRVYDHLWSLCVEEHAYILLGIAAFVYRKRRYNIELLLVVVSVLSILDGAYSFNVLHQEWASVYMRSDTRVGGIFLGAAAFLFFRRHAWVVARFPLLPVWCLAAGLMMHCINISSVAYGPGAAFFAVAIATLPGAPEWFRKGLSWEPLCVLGLVSYSVYMWQQLPFKYMELEHLFGVVAVVVMTGVLGPLSFWLVETPARRWLKAHWVRKLPAA